ncbi:MAG TPA: TIGR00730 family Rossman fold protein [Rhizomicrobium sp.]|jgi:hypothetical protein|nr:TIGR00730 family Rossman fold protein [Rhizomicrobium sp.]
MDKNTPAICVFCGSSHGAKPAYAAAAIRLGTLIGRHGFRMVFGGGNVGLMGDCSVAARDAGAHVFGIIPGFLTKRERPLDGVEEIVVPDMQIRKQRMLAESDAFVILPGGLGTLDELFEVLSIAQLKEHAKPIVIVDTEDFYAPLWPLIERTQREGFTGSTAQDLYRVVKTPDEAIALLETLLGHAPR